MRALITAYALAIFSSFLFSAQQAPAQMWNNSSFFLPLSKTISGRAEAQIRTQIKSQKLIHKHFEAELASPILPFIALGVGYRQTDLIEGVKAKDQMPFVTLTSSFAKQGYRLEYQARAEYLFFDKIKTQDITLYRNKLSFDFPLKINKFTIRSFISNEIFLKQGEKISENRLKIGMREFMSKKLIGDVFYQLRTVKLDSETWVRSNDVGVYTTLLF